MPRNAKPRLRFAKMHGLGNDFMVIDLVTQAPEVGPAEIRRWADRKTGVGFDQALILEPPTLPEVDFDYRIFNADGSAAEQCGNGVRCLARFIRLKELSFKPSLALQTCGRLAHAKLVGETVEVELAAPSVDLADVPFLPAQGPPETAVAATSCAVAAMPSPGCLRQVSDTGTEGAGVAPADAPGSAGGVELAQRVQTSAGLVELTPVSVGNPHGVVFVDNIAVAPVPELGGELSCHPCFPEGANIGFCQVIDRGYMRLRVHERGVGETRACGTGACAAVVAGRLHGLLDASVKVSLPGGKVRIRWQGDGGPVKMTGAATLAFEGELEV